MKLFSAFETRRGCRHPIQGDATRRPEFYSRLLTTLLATTMVALVSVPAVLATVISLPIPLIPEGIQGGDLAGAPVAISGDVAVLRAVTNSGEGGAGSVFVYRNNGTVWVEEAELKGQDDMFESDFGTSVAAFGDLIVVGALGATAAEIDAPDSVRGSSATC